MDDSQHEMAELLAMMSKEFLRDTSQRVQSMRDDATELAIAVDPIQAVTRLIRSAHTIKGGGGTFGFPDLGEAGAVVEREAKKLAAEGVPFGSTLQLEHALAALEERLARLTAEG
jgi:chemotaxis protein histidine kinase CheA